MRAHNIHLFVQVPWHMSLLSQLCLFIYLGDLLSVQRSLIQSTNQRAVQRTLMMFDNWTLFCPYTNAYKTTLVNFILLVMSPVTVLHSNSFTCSTWTKKLDLPSIYTDGKYNELYLQILFFHWQECLHYRYIILALPRHSLLKKKGDVVITWLVEGGIVNHEKEQASALAASVKVRTSTTRTVQLQTLIFSRHVTCLGSLIPHICQKCS